MKEILLEAIKSPKAIIQESKHFVKDTRQNVEESENPRDVRSSYRSLMENMGGNQNGIQQSQQSQQTLGPIPMNTISEGSSLPSGEVPMDLIMNLTKPRQ